MLRLLALSFLLAGAAGSAVAHPHVFVDATPRFVFDGPGRLAGLRITWRYDAFSTLVLYDQLELDRDGDGKLDAQDLERVAKGETDWPPEYEGDTYLWIGGAKVPLARPMNGVARMVGDRVEVVPVEGLGGVPNVREGMTEWDGRAFPEGVRHARRVLPDGRFEGFFVARIAKHASTLR